MPDRRSSVGWRAASCPASAAFTARPASIRRGRSSGHDAQAEARRRHRGVDRAAVGHVDLDAGRRRRRARSRTTARCGTRRSRPRRRACARARRRGPTARRSRPRPRRRAGASTSAGLDRPRAERDRAVAARGRVAVLVPEEHAEVGAVVVGRDEEAAVHVGVAARLVAEQPPHRVDLVRGRRVLAPLEHGRAGDLGRARRHDPERLAGRVVVRRADVHAATIRSS